MLAESFVVDPRKARTSRMRRTVTEAARQLDWEADVISQLQGRRPSRKTFITLTYRREEDWSPRHISDYVKHVRHWLQRRGYGCPYVWVGEVQKRGALHYHMLIWVPRRLRLPRPDQSWWWPHGMSKIETARNPVGYMVKYATKTKPEDVLRLPRGVRLHGNGGASSFSRGLIRLALWPAWLRERNQQSCFLNLYDSETADILGVSAGFTQVRRCRGGMLDATTGEFFETPWRVELNNGVVTVHPKVETVQ